MNHSCTVSSEGIRLRPLAYSDIEQLRLWRNDSENSRYIRKLPEITRSDQELWFASYLADDSCLAFAITNEEEKLVGSVSLYDIVGDRAEFGRLMIGSDKGKGYGRKATKATLIVAFGILGLNKVYASVAVDNLSAIKIYTREGFYVTGRTYNELSKMDEFEIEISRERFDSLKIAFH